MLEKSRRQCWIPFSWIYKWLSFKVIKPKNSNLEILMSLVLAGSYCCRESLSTRAMSCSEDSVSHIPSQPLALMFFLLPLPQCSLSFRDAPLRAKNLAASCSQHFDQLKMRLHYKKKLIKQGLRSAIICSFI